MNPGLFYFAVVFIQLPLAAEMVGLCDTVLWSCVKVQQWKHSLILSSLLEVLQLQLIKACVPSQQCLFWWNFKRLKETQKIRKL